MGADVARSAGAAQVGDLLEAPTVAPATTAAVPAPAAAPGPAPAKLATVPAATAGAGPETSVAQSCGPGAGGCAAPAAGDGSLRLARLSSAAAPHPVDAPELIRPAAGQPVTMAGPAPASPAAAALAIRRWPVTFSALSLMVMAVLAAAAVAVRRLQQEG
jgi:hypothetical protein